MPTDPTPLLSQMESWLYLDQAPRHGLLVLRTLNIRWSRTALLAERKGKLIDWNGINSSEKAKYHLPCSFPVSRACLEAKQSQEMIRLLPSCLPVFLMAEINITGSIASSSIVVARHWLVLSFECITRTSHVGNLMISAALLEDEICERKWVQECSALLKELMPLPGEWISF